MRSKPPPRRKPHAVWDRHERRWWLASEDIWGEQSKAKIDACRAIREINRVNRPRGEYHAEG